MAKDRRTKEQLIKDLESAQSVIAEMSERVNELENEIESNHSENIDGTPDNSVELDHVIKANEQLVADLATLDADFKALAVRADGVDKENALLRDKLTQAGIDSEPSASGVVNTAINIFGAGSMRFATLSRASLVMVANDDDTTDVFVTAGDFKRTDGVVITTGTQKKINRAILAIIRANESIVVSVSPSGARFDGVLELGE